jgi:hypothetical protein
MAQEELGALGWRNQDLLGRRKSDPGRSVRNAARLRRLRRETTMTLDWIAARLCMGALTHAAARVPLRPFVPSVPFVPSGPKPAHP